MGEREREGGWKIAKSESVILRINGAICKWAPCGLGYKSKWIERGKKSDGSFFKQMLLFRECNYTKEAAQ